MFSINNLFSNFFDNDKAQAVLNVWYGYYEIIMSKTFLYWILIFPLYWIFINAYSGVRNVSSPQKIYNRALYLSAISFGGSVIALCFLNKTNAFFQGFIEFKLTPLLQTGWLHFGVDYISMSLIILTNLFIYLCILSIRFVEIRGKFQISELCNKLFFIQWGLVCAFSSLDLLGFFVFFEATLIPIFLIILQGGSRERKTRASYLIAIYTLFGSIFMLYNIIYLFNKYGTTNYLILYSTDISIEDQKILWITFFLAFAAKIPVFPFHIWLPEAHVEAPTIGSVLLAALLLKLGIYGLIRFGLPLFPYGQEYFKQIIVILTIASFFYTNLTAIRQVDIKKIIAYSSVVHMNLIVLGILCISVESLDGAIYQMLAHGIVSGALFFCIGIIYERFKSRFLWYYGGVAFLLPVYAIFLFIFILANISFPTTSNFIGEMLLFLGIFKDNFIIGIFAALSMFWGIIYNMWTYNRICFGNIKINYNSNAKHISHRILRKNISNINSEIQLALNTDRKLEKEVFFAKKRQNVWEQSRLFPMKNSIYDICLTYIEWFNTKSRAILYLIQKTYFPKEFVDVKEPNPNLNHIDIDYIDFFILFLLTFLLFLTGIFSSIILDYISINSTLLIDRVTLMLTIF